MTILALDVRGGHSNSFFGYIMKGVNVLMWIQKSCRFRGLQLRQYTQDNLLFSVTSYYFLRR